MSKPKRDQLSLFDEPVAEPGVMAPLLTTSHQGEITVIEGDCVEEMAKMPENSVDAIVTDPPYALTSGQKGGIASINLTNPYGRARICAGNGPGGFMGKKWDDPGDGTPRGFQQWCQEWATEALRILKPGGHMLVFGGTRTYHRMTCGVEDAGFELRDCLQWLYGSGFPKSHNLTGDWQGFGTALKPGYEPIALARKPLIGTVAANVLEHGTGALNIDGTRVETTDNLNGGAYSEKSNVARNSGSWRGERKSDSNAMRNAGKPGEYQQPTGRWPANVILDEEAAAILDEQSGASVSRIGKPRASQQPGDGWGMTSTGAEYEDGGGPSRFFYTAKASRAERTLGDGSRSSHPTVKPIELMRWLVRLIAPPGGTVLDPFAGSGSTLIAASREGFASTGIEKESNYVAIIRNRVEKEKRSL